MRTLWESGVSLNTAMTGEEQAVLSSSLLGKCDTEGGCVTCLHIIPRRLHQLPVLRNLSPVSGGTVHGYYFFWNTSPGAAAREAVQVEEE